MRLLYVSLICVILTGCSKLGMLLPTGGGVAANGQIGKENTQEVISNDTEITADVVNQITEVPLEFMLLMILGWLLPSPAEMWRGLVGLFKKDKSNG